MKENDGTLALLQDIKELLWGIALLLAGGFLCLIGIMIGNWGIALLAVGILCFLLGHFVPITDSTATRSWNIRSKRRPPCHL